MGEIEIKITILMLFTLQCPDACWVQDQVCWCQAREPVLRPVSAMTFDSARVFADCSRGTRVHHYRTFNLS